MGTTRRIGVFGCGGHGRVVADIAAANGYHEIIWIDDASEKMEALSLERFMERFSGVPVALGVGDNDARCRIHERLAHEGVTPVTLIHPSAVISANASLGEGCVVMPIAVVNAGTHVGNGSIVNSAAVIEHDCKIGMFTHISPNAALGGGVEVGRQAHIGIGASVVPGIFIGAFSTIAAGSVVISSIPDSVMAAGVPAVIKKRLGQ